MPETRGITRGEGFTIALGDLLEGTATGLNEFTMELPLGGTQRITTIGPFCHGPVGSTLARLEGSFPGGDVCYHLRRADGAARTSAARCSGRRWAADATTSWKAEYAMGLSAGRRGE